ncbi:ligand-gated channel [Tistrella bauzanensis]|uniref:Ligand-gated channel n=1 Tax=Tistrella bauzanensis TaxID=657419 RepID=A0ABQ1INZ1_9PROT|nr:TonB-dependent siderophore receptor [Tistrella bauzanensis]GGB48263.1 ligand-gated channel [Tistrella bauzanensis]
MEASGPALARRGRNLAVAGRRTAGQRRADLVADVALAVGMAGLMLATMPAARAADAAGIQLAQAGQSFDIPAQPLAGAITSFGRQSGLQVTVEAAIANDLQSPGVSGSYTPDEALSRLLAGTGVSYRFIDANTVTLVRGTAADGAVVLDPLSIDATRRAESAWGPVAGFVAKRASAATKTDTPLLETPQSISVVTRDQMDAQAAQTMPQALRYTAGMQTDRNGADERTDFLYARGFQVSQYLDGLRLIGGTWATPQIDSYGLERIEIVRGPSSVLYGQVSPGGLANLVSKRPQPDAFNEVQLQFGEYGRLQTAFDMTGPLTEDGDLSYRLSGLARSADTPIDQTKEERYAINPAITWRAGDDTTLTLLGKYQNDPALGAYQRLPAYGTVLHNPSGDIPTDLYIGDPTFDKEERTQYGIGYEFEHRFDDTFTVRQNARFFRTDSDFGYLYTGRLMAADSSVIRRSGVLAEEVNDAITIDNQLQAKFTTGAVGHTALFGLDYQNNHNDSDVDYLAANPIDYNNPQYGSPGIDFTPFFEQNTSQRLEQLGLYAQDQISIDRWRFTLGARHDWLNSNTNDRLTNTSTKVTDQKFTGRVGALYLFDNGLAPYASYSESFEPLAGTNDIGEPLKPTTGQQYEIGIKYQPTGYNSFVSLALYDLTQQNVLSYGSRTIIDGSGNPQVISFSTQNGEVSSRGIDIEGKISLNDNISLTAAYSYLETEVTEGSTGDNTAGKTPVYLPENSGSIWADYRFIDGYFNGLGLGAGVRISDETYGDAANSFTVPGYAVMDAALRYDLGNLAPDLTGARLAVNATNLFDKIYVADCQNNTNCYYGSRRKVYATLSYQW